MSKWQKENEENKFDFGFSTVFADGLAPLGARALAVILVAKHEWHTGTVLQD